MSKSTSTPTTTNKKIQCYLNKEVKTVTESEYLQCLSSMPKSRQVLAARSFRAFGELHRFNNDIARAYGMPESICTDADTITEDLIQKSEMQKGHSARTGPCIENPVAWIRCCLNLLAKSPTVPGMV